MRLALAGRLAALALASGWLAFALLHLAASARQGLVANALAGDVVQSGAAMTLLAVLLLAASGGWRHAPRAAVAAFAALPVVALSASTALGQPWRDVAGAPLLALAMAAPLALLAVRAPAAARVAGMALMGLAWAVQAGRLVALVPDVAILSYVAPGTVALLPALALLAPDSLLRRGRAAPTWT